MPQSVYVLQNKTCQRGIGKLSSWGDSRTGKAVFLRYITRKFHLFHVSPFCRCRCWAWIGFVWNWECNLIYRGCCWDLVDIRGYWSLRKRHRSVIAWASVAVSRSYSRRSSTESWDDQPSVHIGALGGNVFVHIVVLVLFTTHSIWS